MKKNMILSAGKLDSISLCMRQFQYSSILNLTPKASGLNAPMDSGNLMHKLLELHYYRMLEKKPLEETIKEVMMFCRFYGASTYASLDSNTIELCARRYRDYAVKYKAESYVTQGIEVPFAKVLYEDENLRVIIEGIIDWIVMNASGSRIIVDHKTTTSWEDPPMLTNQFLCYAWVGETRHLVVNKIIMKDEGEINRIPYDYAPRLIEEWVENMIYYAKEVSAAVEREHFPADFTSCRRFYKYPCQFLPVCQQEPVYRMSLIESNYQEKDAFNPVKDRKSVLDIIKEMT